MDRLGRSEWAGPTSKNRSGYNPSNKDSTRSSSGRWKGVKSLHNEEMVERRAMGLCFKCGGKYHPTLHKCPEKSLRVLILREGESVNEDGEIMSMEVSEIEEEEEAEAECKVIGVLGSMGEYRTMKI
ncbi:hypothetical protein KIW84_031712 [Lathyrus oleraceus]|uniref:Pentatricopeptide repeat-containing protein n=1 Tax=Pisum sativum TaxID=3888 RepID=A0A9D4XSG8_PEA|nr:hypothetical protein KIW84_031712 [Pisum sativum]